MLGDLVTGIDLHLIGIALLSFGYGVYELLISPIEAARERKGDSGLLDIRDLDQLKKKLLKVLVVALSGFLVTGDVGRDRKETKPSNRLD